MKFSIVIPVYNAEKTIDRCLRSALKQEDAEVIVVNDGSTDFTSTRVHLSLSNRTNTTFCTLQKNLGAGIARNYGVRMAQGDWVVFLDADDELADGATQILSKRIDQLPDDIDIIGYNPLDARWLRGERQDLLNAYAALRMDGSVIFTAIRRSLFANLRFRAGYHEDVEVMFSAYRNARRTAYLGTAIYRKGPNGVTGSVSERHIDGFINAWRGVVIMAEKESVPAEFIERGIVGVAATRIREIFRKAKSSQVYELINYLHEAFPRNWLVLCANTTLQTQYAIVARHFASVKTAESAVFDRTWSCKDLQHSAYLGPDEVRACCKRFFVDGERRGDVVLLGKGDEMTPTAILAAKLELLAAINAGEQTSCSGCPWLEFKEHGPVLERVDYLSMEHHSVCNLRCAYCPSMYYDGRRPSYDALLLGSSILADDGSVVWGGGEPTVSPEFEPLLQLFSKRGARQRVLTNSVKFNYFLQSMLNVDQNVEVVTSIDAGTIDTFKKVRGADKLTTVIGNVARYAEHAAERVTIKYILTEDNCSQLEIEEFVQLMMDNSLLSCNFQISCDFRQEHATREQYEAVECLFSELLEIGAECVFIDDLSRIRFAGFSHPLAQEVILWGKGEQAAAIRARVRCVAQVDDEDKLIPDGYPILIAASQSYPRIYHTLKRRGLANRIMKGLVL